MEKEQIDDSIITLINDFNKRYNELRSRLPYHINVIDELHINENAHSRILCKLLLYQSKEGIYEMLESLIAYIAEKNTNFNRIQIKTPIITQEHDRIDLWVQDKVGGYAIIIENKVYDANDQDAQLARYIQKTRDDGFMDENIYVVYMSSINEHSPTEQTWIDEKGNSLKEMFSNRYAHISFKEDILSWLKKSVLPNIRIKEDYMYTAISQYIDYLEGHFDKREINKDMNMELNNYLEQNLGFAQITNDSEKLTKLSEKEQEIEKLLDYVRSKKDEIQKGLITKQWNEPKTKSAFEDIIKNVASELQLEEQFMSKEDSSFWIKLSQEDWVLSIVFQKYADHRFFIYIGIPSEEYVDNKYIELGINLFKESTYSRNHPYGWEWVEEYDSQFEALLKDINNGNFKKNLQQKTKDVLKQIKEKSIIMA